MKDVMNNVDKLKNYKKMKDFRILSKHHDKEKRRNEIA